MTGLEGLSIKIFADRADLATMQALYRRPYVRGFTTNPTLMRKAGITNYESFARDVLTAIPDRPISFEIFSDEFNEMERQILMRAPADIGRSYRGDTNARTHG